MVGRGSVLYDGPAEHQPVSNALLMEDMKSLHRNKGRRQAQMAGKHSVVDFGAVYSGFKRTNGSTLSTESMESQRTSCVFRLLHAIMPV